ncbi:HET-domain-containing protein [Melanomma pulvis-pyrius CBS 109.77]|uniref:HET-domain-containing protein n=1 Tax=Melanomma pulvis-pyrius CBS 109.77 TaxID=1314802 RepID=A0A6A6XN64_9PLEO|nr:HET-domain-containing protein [Melanomma pulvis-pyrius CBS 109.77]
MLVFNAAALQPRGLHAARNVLPRLLLHCCALPFAFDRPNTRKSAAALCQLGCRLTPYVSFVSHALALYPYSSMHLLKYGENGELTITTFDDNKLPLYTILSHTWGTEAEEVTFADLVRDDGKHEPGYIKKPGYKKIRFCGQQARQDGLQYFWVDTCCIIQTHHRRQCPTKRVAYAAEHGGRMYSYSFSIQTY